MSVDTVERQMSMRLVLAGLMLATFLAAMDGSIVSTAMPTITGLLGGFNLYSWVFSIYMLTTTVTVPIYGKLADLYGRKRVLLFGVTLFLVGSVLCGFAQSMLQLVIFRGIQGLGGGAILPISITILGDLFPVEQRARIQGLMGSVWGISAVTGPTVGGLIVDNFSWRWIFLINVPAGALAVTMIFRFFHEDIERRSHKIDYAGAIALSLGTGALLVGLTSGGRSWPWASLSSAAVFATAAVLLLLFLVIERRAPEPVLPLSLFRNPQIAVSNLAGFLIGGVMVGTITYVPLFAQGVLGTTATVAGGVMATMSLGWPLAGAASGRVMLRWGYRNTAILGAALILLGTSLFLTIGTSTHPAYIALYSFIVGGGLGFATNAFIVGIQNEVEWRQRGAATSSNLFLRSLGGTIWVAALGSVVNNAVRERTQSLPRSFNLPPDPLDTINSLLDPTATGRMAPEILAPIRQALASGIHSLYLWELATMAAAFLVILWMPRGRGRQDYQGE